MIGEVRLRDTGEIVIMLYTTLSLMLVLRVFSNVCGPVVRNHPASKLLDTVKTGSPRQLSSIPASVGWWCLRTSGGAWCSIR